MFNSKNIFYISAIGLSSIFISKSIIKRKKLEKFNPTSKDNAEKYLSHKIDQETDYYANLATVRPGFPLPKSENTTNDSTAKYERKSKYEGSGMSVLSRKSGDRLGFLDRRNND